MQEECHAKLTGAGGGGCVVAFPQGPICGFQGLINTLENGGFTVYQDVSIDEKGLLFEEK